MTCTTGTSATSASNVVGQKKKNRAHAQGQTEDEKENRPNWQEKQEQKKTERHV